MRSKTAVLSIFIIPKLFVAVTVTILIMVLTGFACADSNEDFEYEIVNGEVAITLYKGNSRILEIPAFIDGLPVVSLNMGWNVRHCNQDMVEKIILPPSVKTLGESALYGCYLKSIDGLEYIEHLEDQAIWGAGSYLQSVALPNLKSVSDFACFSGKWLSIPDNLEIVDGGTFDVSEGITLLPSGSTPLWCSCDEGLYTYDQKKLVMVFLNSIHDSLVVPEGTEVIGLNAMAYTDFAEITLPRSLTLIEDGNFAASMYKELRVYVYAGTYAATAMSELAERYTHLKIILLDDPETKTYAQMLNDIVDEVTSPDMTDYQKAFALNEWVCDHVVYDYEALEWTDALMTGRGLCNAYAKLYGRLLTAASIENGYSGNVDHIFNAVCLDGTWTYVDTTWNDTGDGANHYFGFNNEIRRVVYGDLAGSEVFPATSGRYHTYYVRHLYDEMLESWISMYQDMMNDTDASFIDERFFPTIDGTYNEIAGIEFASLLNEHPWNYTQIIRKADFNYDTESGNIQARFISSYDVTDYDYTYRNNMIMITGYLGSGTDITIPGEINGFPVGYIAEYAFAGNDKLTSVTFPANMQEIGSNAFEKCGNLTSVSFSGPVARIGTFAFDSCFVLREVNGLGYVNDEIGYCAFDHCEYLTSVEISAKRIGAWCFGMCAHLTEVHLRDGVESIDSCAFSSLSRITEIELPATLISIESGVFKGTSITRIVLPENVSSIMPDFVNPDTSILIHPDNQHLDAFNGLIVSEDHHTVITFDRITPIGTCQIPEGFETINDWAFSSCDTITSLHCSQSLQYIGNNAFSDCKNLQSVTLGQGLTTIEESTFSGSRLFSITIPSTIVSIGEYAFYGCDDLTEALYSGTSEDWRTITINEGNEALSNALIRCSDKTISDRPLIPLLLEESTSISIIYHKVTKYFSYIPEKSGLYIFASSGDYNYNKYGALFDQSWSRIIGSDDGGEENNFEFTYHLESGKQYFFSACYLDPYYTGSFTVRLSYFIPDPDIILPASLTTIESEAFTGLPEGTVIRISANVIAIAADAFDTGTILLVPEGSNWVQWAEGNRYIVVEE